MSVRTALLVVFVVLLVAALGVVLGVTCSKSHAIDKDLDYKAVKTFPPLSNFVSSLNTLYDPYSNSNTPLVVPMTWDEDEGAYMITLSINGMWIPLVFDSGSSHISAKGLQCQWKQCDNNNNCTITSCPKTEAYIPRGPQVSLNLATKSTLEYGSQKSHVTHHLEPFALFDTRPNCADLARLGPSGFQHVSQYMNELYPTGAPLVTFGPTLLYSIYSIEGTTTSNIFGMAQDSDSAQPAVLDALFPKLKSKVDDAAANQVWSITCYPSHCMFALGALRCGPAPVKFVPLLRPAEFKKFLTLFYTVKLHSVLVNNKKVKSAALPKFVILDTGTTYTYCSQTFKDGLTKAGYKPGQTSVTLVLGNSLNTVSLQYKPSQLQNAFVTELSDMESMFNQTPVLLLGIEQMFYFYWEYNLREQMLGVAPLLPL